jgi:hypothetical protein
MTFVPIIDPSALWEEEDTGLIDSLSSQYVSPIVDDTVGRVSPAFGDDVESVKAALCGMGFGRAQAVAADT